MVNKAILILLTILIYQLGSITVSAQQSDLVQQVIELEKQRNYEEALSLIHKNDDSANIALTSARLRLYQRLASALPIESSEKQTQYLDSALTLHSQIWTNSNFTAEQKRILSGERKHLKDRLLGQAKTLFNEADFKSSLVRLEQTLTINKKDTSAVLLAAYAHYNLNNYSEAYDYLNELEQMGALTPATVLLGVSMLRDSQSQPNRFIRWESYGEAYRYSEVFEAKFDSIRTDYWTQTGTHFLTENKKDSALYSFRQLLPTTDSDVVYTISLLMYDLNDSDAFKFTRKYSEIIDSPELKAKLLLLILEHEADAEQKWLSEQSKLLTEVYPESAELHFLRGKVLENQKKDKRARSHFQKAIDLNYEYDQAVRAMGLNLYQQALDSNSDEEFQKFILDSRKYLSYAQYLNPEDSLVSTILNSIEQAAQPINKDE